MYVSYMKKYANVMVVEISTICQTLRVTAAVGECVTTQNIRFYTKIHI